MDRETAQQLARITVISLIAIGFLLAVIYVMTGRTRTMLILFGAAIELSALVMILTGVAQVVVILLALALVALAIREGVRDTRARIVTMRTESREREEAFGEYLEATTRKEVAEETAAKDADPPA